MKCCKCNQEEPGTIFKFNSEKIFPKIINKKIKFFLCDNCFGEIILKLIGKYPPDNYELE